MRDFIEALEVPEMQQPKLVRRLWPGTNYLLMRLYEMPLPRYLRYTRSKKICGPVARKVCLLSYRNVPNEAGDHRAALNPLLGTMAGGGRVWTPLYVMVLLLYRTRTCAVPTYAQNTPPHSARDVAWTQR